MFYTFGHSNLSIEEIKRIVEYYGIDIIVDVRRFPTSKFSWLTKEEFERKFGKKYIWMGEKLGGFREEGYENYMKSEEFKEGIKNLMKLGEDKRVAIMCSEKLWFKCHRRYIAEHLATLGYPVSHIVDYKDRLHPSFKFDKVDKNFFERDTKDVAIDLLGKIIVRKVGKRVMVGKIVETEAYYGEKDPASRAYHGKKNYNRGMWFSGGCIFIYMVHANWMFNITTDGEEAQAVLIRAVEPLVGIDIMRKRRDKKIRKIANGPGKWTRAFDITPFFNGLKLGDKIFIANSPWKNFEIGNSHRIGVKNDLEEPLRFFITSSKFLSR